MNNLETSTDDIPFFNMNGEEFIGKIVRIYDGDTVYAVILFNNKLTKFKIRLYGIDTPELKPSKSIEENERSTIKINAQKAKDKISELILNKIVYIKCYEFDNFGRLLADIKINQNDKNTISDILIEEGLGVPYFGGKKN